MGPDESLINAQCCLCTIAEPIKLEAIKVFRNLETKWARIIIVFFFNK